MATKKKVPAPARAKRATRSTFGDELLAAMAEVVEIDEGRRDPAKVTRMPLTGRTTTAKPAPEYAPAAIKRLRESLSLSQPVFAAALNVQPMTLRGWEQGTRKPDAAARRLLELTERHPEWVLETVQAR